MCAFTEEVLKMGKAEGKAEGRIEGRTEERIAAIKRIMKKLSMDRDEAMDFLDIPVAERGPILAGL